MWINLSMNIDKIAKKISASKRINIKNLLYMDIDL